MSRFVLDCSVTMAWCFDDETDVRAEDALDALVVHDAIVPNHWPLEVANVLAIAERRQRTTAVKIAEFIEILSTLHIDVDDQTAGRAFGDVLALARTHRLSAYDAAYLELALRMGYPLASLDRALNEAAVRIGVALWTA